MIVISDALALSLAESKTGNNPVLGWHNIAKITSITTDDADPLFPAVNLSNQITHLEWRGADVGVNHVTVDTAGYEDDLSYVGIARHNFGTAGISVTIEKETSPGVWATLVNEQLLADDGPAMFLFTEQGMDGIRLKLGEGTEAPRLSIVYVGKVTYLERRIYVGHTPIVYGRGSKTTSNMSENGEFLGRVILSENTATTFKLDNITPTWYRMDLDPFVKASQKLPFFFNWRPGDYPLETGFCWTTSTPKPVNNAENGMMMINVDVRGIVS